MNNSVLVVIGIMAVIIISGCTYIEGFGRKVIEFDSGTTCSKMKLGSEILGYNPETILEAVCEENCGNFGLEYANYECRKSLICKCYADN